MPHPTLVEEEVPGLAVALYATVGCYPWDPHLYLKRNSGGEGDVGKTEKRGRRGSFGSNVKTHK